MTIQEDARRNAPRTFPIPSPRSLKVHFVDGAYLRRHWQQQGQIIRHSVPTSQRKPAHRPWTSETVREMVREFSAKLCSYLRKLNTVLNLPWIVPVSTEKVRADRETLKSARVRLGMDQAQLAEAAGLTRTTLSHFENGKTAPHDSTREAIQQALELRGIVFTNGDRPGFYFDKTKVTIPAL